MSRRGRPKIGEHSERPVAYGPRTWPEGHVSTWPPELRRAYLSDRIARARVAREEQAEREREEIAA